MPIVPSASNTASPVSSVSPTPSSASTSPISAPKSSSSTTGSSGVVDWRMNCHQDSCALELARLVDRRAEREALEADRHEQDDDRDDRRRELPGVGELLDALVEREHRPEREQQQRDDEGVEEPVAPVAERVLGRGGALGPLAAEQEEALVRRCRPRSAPPPRASTTSPSPEADELRDRDARIGRQRRENRARSPTRGHARTLSHDLRTRPNPGRSGQAVTREEQLRVGASAAPPWRPRRRPPATPRPPWPARARCRAPRTTAAPAVHSRMRGPPSGTGAGPSAANRRSRNSSRGRVVAHPRPLGHPGEDGRRLGVEVQHAQQLRHVDVLGREAAAQHVVGVGHQLDARPGQVHVQVARGQVEGLAGREGDPVEQQRGEHARVAGVALGQLEDRRGPPPANGRRPRAGQRRRRPRAPARRAAPGAA